MKKIELPESQLQEVLYELINRLNIDRKTIMLSCSVLNLPANILKLRKKGVKIEMLEFNTTNKFGRNVSFGKYRLEDKKSAVVIYKEMKANQRPKACTNLLFAVDGCEVKTRSKGCVGCEWYQSK